MRPRTVWTMQSGVDAGTRDAALTVRSALERGHGEPVAFRAALERVPAVDRDAWVDLALGVPEPPADGHELPRGCVPYLPCGVDTLLRAVEAASLTAADVFVDIGSGLGRATALVHLLTGATALGLEIQAALVEAARHLAARLQLTRVTTVAGDASALVTTLANGDVFLLYCPFSGERLSRLFASLEPLALTRPLRICCVDMAPPACPWLALHAAPAENLRIYRSTQCR